METPTRHLAPHSPNDAHSAHPSAAVTAPVASGQASFPSRSPHIDPIDLESDFGIELLDARTSRPIFNGKLFSLKNNRTRRAPNPGLFAGKYNYEEKYEADQWGSEMRQESRFYRTYVDECDNYDLERMDAWRDVLDVLLVFIGLFSAIVTTFAIQTSQALQPNYGQITAVMVYNLIIAQQALSSGTTTSFPLIQNPVHAQATPSALDKWVNGLWFASLAVSLSTALLTVLTKQWLYHYMSQTSGSSQERARLRQFRFAGIERYHVPMIIDLLPVAVHLALALFLVGLTLFLYSLDLPLTIVVSVISGIAYTVYILSAILPLYDPQCPYQSPISTYLHLLRVMVLNMATSLWRWSLSRRILCVKGWGLLLGRVHHLFYNASRNSSPTPLETRLLARLKHMDSLPTLPESLHRYERQVVSQNCHQLDIDAITWLWSTSSNESVRSVSFQAVVGLTPSDADPRELISVLRPYYDEGLRSVTNRWAINDGREADYHRLMQVACIEGFEVKGMPSKHENVDPKEEDGRRVFNYVILPALQWASEFYLHEFLAPGRRSHVRLPLSVWRFCISFLSTRTILDPLLVLRLLEIRPDANSVDTSPTTFIDALRHNDHLNSLLLDVLTKHLNIPRQDISSFYSVPLVVAIHDWALSHFKDTTTHTEWGPNPQQSVYSLLTASFKAFRHNNLDALDLESQIQIRDTCARFLCHDASVARKGWGTYIVVVGLLRKMWHPNLTCPLELLSSLISHLQRIPPASTPEDTTEKSLRIIPEILRLSLNPGPLFDMLRERDVLSLALVRSTETGSYDNAFWGYRMCWVSVFAWNDQGVDVSEEWAIRWSHYMSAPERLSFIAKRLLAGDKWLRPPDNLVDRLAPLLELTKKYPGWNLAFESLVGLLEDDIYMKSIRRCDAPRHQLSNLLVHIRAFFSIDAAKHHIPRFDKHDTPILVIDKLDSNEKNMIPPAIESLRTRRINNLEALEDLREESTLKVNSPAHIWNTVKGSLARWRASGNEDQTLERIEEAAEDGGRSDLAKSAH